MKKSSIEYYDWIDDVGPELLKNLNEILVAKGVEPLRDLHGGAFKDNTWVDILESEDYRNYWHAYIHVWGERLNNDSYQVVYFPEDDDDKNWEYYTKALREWAKEVYDPVDPNWTDDLVTAMRKLVKENFSNHVSDDDDESARKVVFWWCW